MQQPWVVFSSVTANATTPMVSLARVAERARLRPWTLYVYGTFGGGSVQMQASPDGVNWVNLGTPITQPSVAAFDVTANFLQAVIAGASSPSLTAVVL
jgi:hypothetical protein